MCNTHTPLLAHHIFRSFIDIALNGNEVEEDRPSGAMLNTGSLLNLSMDEHRRRKLDEKLQKKFAEALREADMERNVIKHILERNSEVENTHQSKTESKLLSDAKMQNFMDLKSPELEDFIHARKFDAKTFSKGRLAGADGKLNNLRYKGQTAESIASDCSPEEPCLVWLVWSLRSQPIVLKSRPPPTFNIRKSMPEFTVVYAGPESTKLPSEYLSSTAWISVLDLVFKGVKSIPVCDILKEKADNLALAMEPRLDYHIAERVDRTRHNYWTLRFTRDNLAPMAAVM